jgi:hypothetical protein
MTMRVLICGDRNWTDREAIRAWLCKLQDEGYNVLIEGGANGADRIAEQEARLVGGFEVLEFPADWGKFGRAAGPIRNKQMLTEGKPELVIAFHPDLNNSKGTKNMVTQATKAGVTVIVVNK